MHLPALPAAPPRTFARGVIGSLAAIALAGLAASATACGGDEPEVSGEAASGVEPELGEATSVSALVADGDDLVATFGARFVRLRADGTRVALGEVPTDGAQRTLGYDGSGLLLFGEHVYFRALRQSSLGRIPLAGGAPELLRVSEAAFNFFPGPLAARSDGLFVGNGYGDAELWAIAPDGAIGQQLVALGDRAFPQQLWADPARLVWTDTTPSVKALDLAEGAREVPAVRTLLEGVAFEAAAAVANGDAVFVRVPDPAAGRTLVKRVPKVGGPAADVIGAEGLLELAVDDAHLWLLTQAKGDAYDYVVREHGLTEAGAVGAAGGRVVARSRKRLSHLTVTRGFAVWVDEARGQLRRAEKL